MNNIYILQKKVTKGATAPAIDTFVMCGFETPEDCKILWSNLVHEATPITVMSLDEYLKSTPIHRFFDETGSAGLLKRCPCGCTMGTITPLLGKLLSREVLLIDVVDDSPGKYQYSQSSMNNISEINARIKEEVLLGRNYVGSYIYMHGGGEPLEHFVETSLKMRNSVEFLVLYINSRIATIHEVESYMYSFQHQSIVITDYALMQLDIVCSEFRFRLIENVLQEVMVDGIH